MDKLRIKKCVEEGRYEEALQVSMDSIPSEINRAHIRMLAKYRDDVQIRELINQAKGRIVNETALEKGRRYSRIGFKEQAVALLTQSLPNSGDADDYLLTGQLMEQLRSDERALEFFEAAVRLRGEAKDRLWLGTVLERLSRPEEALDQYKEAVRQRGDADDYLAVGGLLFSLSRFDEAQKALQKARALGDCSTAVQLLQNIKAVRGRARIKKLFAPIAELLSRTAEKKKKEEKKA